MKVVNALLDFVRQIAQERVYPTTTIPRIGLVRVQQRGIELRLRLGRGGFILGVCPLPPPAFAALVGLWDRRGRFRFWSGRGGFRRARIGRLNRSLFGWFRRAQNRVPERVAIPLDRRLRGWFRRPPEARSGGSIFNAD